MSLLLAGQKTGAGKAGAGGFVVILALVHHFCDAFLIRGTCWSKHFLLFRERGTRIGTNHHGARLPFGLTDRAALAIRNDWLKARLADGHSTTHQAAIGLLGLTDRAALAIRDNRLKAQLAVGACTTNQAAVRFLGLTDRAALPFDHDRVLIGGTSTALDFAAVQHRRLGTRNTFRATFSFWYGREKIGSAPNHGTDRFFAAIRTKARITTTPDLLSGCRRAQQKKKSKNILGREKTDHCKGL